MLMHLRLMMFQDADGDSVSQDLAVQEMKIYKIKTETSEGTADFGIVVEAHGALCKGLSRCLQFLHSPRVFSLLVESSSDPLCSRRARWRAPVIQATGRLRLADRLSSGVLGCSGLCRSGVRAKFGIDMVILRELGTTRSPKEG
ncbi:hypothetical protein AOLI_G00151430 [Acnodon oligacanthus]